MRRTYENDIREAYNAMQRKLTDDDDGMLVDSGSNIHFLTLEDARNYFMSRRSTQLRVLGINGVRERCKAEGEIEMLVRDHLGKQLHLSLGTGYTSGKIPKSLLSASRLMASGAILHFEKGASYMELPIFKSRIDLVEKNGLFYIPTDKVAEIEVLDVDMENVDAVAGEASSAYSAASTESWTFSANATSAEALREEHELAQEYMAKEHAMALAAEVAVMVANCHCDAENDQEHHAAIKAVTAALADGPSADDRRQQMNELVEARAKKFIKLAKENDFEIVYLQNNPKVKGDAKKFPEGKTSWKLYERFKKGTTIKGAIELGATMDRINDDYEHGYIRFPGRESREPGHVFLADGEKASDLVSLLGIDYDMGLSNTGEFEQALKGAEEAAKKAEEKLRKNFNEVIATCYDAEEDCRRILDGRGERECCKGKAPNASLSRTPPAQGTRSARLRVQVLVCNRKFTVHLWMYAARYCGRNRNPSEARSHAGKEACGCCQTLDPIRVQYAQAWHKIFTRQRR